MKNLRFAAVVIFTLLFSLNAYSAEWVFINDEEGRKHFIDRESLKDESGFRWSYYKSEYPSDQTGNDYLTKKTYTYKSAVSYMAFNCKTKTLTPISTRYMDGKGEVVHTIRYTNEKAVIEGDKTWELDDNPETFRASVIKFVCK